MSNPYGPKIETIADWNAALGSGCCCGMPVPPEPEMLFQRQSVRVDLVNPFYDDTGALFATRITTSHADYEYSGESDGYGIRYPSGNIIGQTIGPSYVQQTKVVVDTRTLTETNETLVRVFKCGAWDAPALVDTRTGSLVGTTVNFSGFAEEISVNPDRTVNFSFSVEQVLSETISITVVDNEWSYIVTTISPDDTVVTEPYPAGESYYAPTYTYEDAIDLETVRVNLASVLAATSFGECEGFEDFAIFSAFAKLTEVRYELPDDLGSLAASASGQKARYRWQVPDSHTGTYFKITWDVVSEPLGWDATIDDPDYEPPAEEPEDGFPPVPQIPKPGRPIRYSRKNLTVEWTGPGTGAQSDPSWLAGDWQMLDLPEEPGERRVINIRYTMFRDDPLAP